MGRPMHVKYILNLKSLLGLQVQIFGTATQIPKLPSACAVFRSKLNVPAR